MPNVFKQFGARGTGWFKNQFQTSVWKLTLFYTAILALILFISSSFIYGAFSRRLEYRFRTRGPVIEVVRNLPPPTAADVRADLIRSIIIVNGLLLGCAALLSYCLAYLTVKPLQEMDEKQKRFFGDASHELRTPLSILQIDLENQLADTNITAAQRTQLTSHLEEVKRIGTLVNNLLTLSRFDQYTINAEKNFSSVRLVPLMEQIILQLQTLAKHHQVTIIFSPPELKDISITSNPTILSHAFTNIIKNGIIYNKPNGTIHITIAPEKNGVTITVIDTGIGMSKEETEKVFDRFYRADQSRSRSITGTGLGLSIAHSSIQYLNGSVDIASIPEQGTTITVHLP